MEYTNETPTTTFKVKGVELTVIEPYAEGHTITANEANVLNQCLKENLRNNFSTQVDKAIAEAGSVDAVDKQALQNAFNEYMSIYEFGLRRSGGGGGSAALDPVEKRARDIARAHVRAALKAKGYKISDVKGAKITEYALALLEKKPELREEAARQIENEKGVAAELLEDFAVE